MLINMEIFNANNFSVQNDKNVKLILCKMQI